MINRIWKKTGAKHAATLFLLSTVCAIMVLACLCAYQYDNKYTVSGPQASQGVLLLDEQSLEKYPVLMLVDGWEYYGGRLLAPEDFAAGTLLPDEYLYIGQYGGFEGGDSTASPHGSATYRLVIETPDEPRAYTLEMPEIFSAYRAYINGSLAAVMGSPDPESYRPETLNRTVSFEAEGSIEIVIAASDFSHLYSGMVYPPAFGEPDVVSRLLSTRFLFRTALCIAALTIGLLSILVGVLSRRSKPAVLYGLLCLSFVGYICYPILKTFFSGYYPFYALENFSFCAMFVVVMLLQRRICGLKSKWSFAFPLFVAFTCAASVILHLSLPAGNLQIMYAYSRLISVYEWITAGYLTVTAARAAWKDSVYSGPLLTGVLAFDTALVMDRLLPLHEPVVTGWFPELASFVLVLSIGAVIGKEVAAEYAKSAAMEERARSTEQLLEMQRTYYPLLQEKIEDAKTAQHDLRHHLVTINGFLESGQYDRLREYVAEYQAPIRETEPVSYSQNDVANILAHHYIRLAAEYGIELTLRLDIGSEVKLTGADLCALLSNLLENAMEACRRQTDGRRFTTLTARYHKSSLAFHMENSGDAVVKDESGFFSSKKRERKGCGLDSIKAIARRYNGEAEFHYDEETRVFTSTVLLTAL